MGLNLEMFWMCLYFIMEHTVKIPKLLLIYVHDSVNTMQRYWFNLEIKPLNQLNQVKHFHSHI